MTEITPTNAHDFFRRFLFRGGRLRRWRIVQGREDSQAVLTVRVREVATSRAETLRLTIDGVEEYRFQRRPGQALRQLQEVKIGYFGNLVYLNLDAFPEEGPAKVMDYRASDCFVAGIRLFWEIVKKKPA